MNFSAVRQKVKPLMFPVAMVCGALLHDVIELLAFLAPYLIFVMLLITFSKVKLSEMRVTRFTWSLLAVQVFGALAAYFALLPFSEDVAQGTFICVLCPTATAAPVITGMLGGNVSRVATYSIVINLAVAVIAPPIFALMGGGPGAELGFLALFLNICKRVMPLIVLPLLVAEVLRRVSPKTHRVLATHQSLSFYIWAVALFIVVGRAVTFVMDEPAEKIPEMIVIALFSLVACVAQFYIGRKVGYRHGDPVAGAQSLGQKNTVLAIWMAMTHLNPISSVGPAAYVAWHNTINSYQLYKKTKTDHRHEKHKTRRGERI